MAVHITAIHRLVSTLVGLHNGAIQAYASENALSARIRQDLCTQPEVGARGGIPAHRPGCYRGVASELEFVAEQALQCVIVHKEHHEIGGRAPDLITHAAAVNGHKHGSAPAMPGATGCDSPAVVAAEYKGELHFSWNDGDTFRRCQQILWNALIWSAHDLLEDLGSFVGSASIFLAVR